MKNLLQAVLIALLIISGMALWFSLKLFPQREELKGRTQRLEQAIRQVAATIEQSDDNPAFIAINEDQLKTFRAPPGAKASPMETALSQLATAAQNQLGRLNDTRRALADTKASLAKAEENLQAAKTELAAARDTIREREEKIAGLESSLAEKDTAIRNLERAEKELKSQMDVLRAAIDDLEIQKKNLMDQIASLERKITTLEARATPDAAKTAMAQGQLGVVLVARPDWNFVVLRFNKESTTEIAPNLELLVHRADQLVAKVRVESVKENMAIAEILDGWERLTPRDGDSVML